MNKIIIVTSIHPDFDARVWRHAVSAAKLGFDVHLVCPWEVGNESVREGVCFHPFLKVNSRKSRLWQIPLRVFGRLRPLLRDAGVVHFHDIDLLPWMALLSLSGKKVVYDVHENYSDEVNNKLWIPIYFRRPISWLVFYAERILAKIVGHAVLVAPSQLKTFSDIKGLKIEFLKNYATLNLLNSVKNDYFERKDAVIFIGSQHENNGSLIFLDIVLGVHKRYPNVKFFAPDRFVSLEFKNKYLERCTQLGLTECLVLLPNVLPKDIMNVLNSATIGVNPNLRVAQQINGIHTKLFEFMAAGLPIVSSDLPHQKELLEETQAGLLAQPESIDSFIEAICFLLNNREKSHDMGILGRKWFAEKYCWESQMPIMLNFYNSILEGGKG